VLDGRADDRKAERDVHAEPDAEHFRRNVPLVVIHRDRAVELTLHCAEKGSKKTPKRLGRGIGSGKGKTSGKGHKGQKARAGGFHKVGFEGGQMPLQRRFPKSGFRSRVSLSRQEVRLSDIEKMKSDVVTDITLKEEGVIRKNTRFVKIILSGELTKVVHIKGVLATAGARQMIESLGGTVEV
jgi:large subunit ribosomal protein L15